MSFIVSLHADDKLSDNRKYRTSFNAIKLWESTSVNIGNFSNLNIFCDNTIELGCSGFTIPPIIVPIPATEIAVQATHIKIIYNGYTVIGAITDWDYINDNNIRFTYVVDSYMSAMMSGLIDKAEGICTRVNMNTGNALFMNEQSEPFSGSDLSWAHPDITESFNSSISEFEGITVGSQGVATNGVCYVMTVSPAIVDFLNVTQPFVTPPIFTPGLKDTQNFHFYGGDSTIHAGSYYKGFPLKFSNFNAVQRFIKDILGGCGFRAIMPANGWSTMSSVTRRMLSNSAEMMGANATFHKNWNNDEYECIRFINGNDLYNLYAIPNKFATNTSEYGIGYHTYDLTVMQFPGLDDIHPWGTESVAKGKLLMYPYIYFKMVTCNGDNVQIIPQVHYGKDSSFTPNFSVKMNVRFVGGDTPRLMGRIVPGFSGLFEGSENEPYENSSVCEWFTIRSYPAIALSYNASTSQQMQRDIQSFRKMTSNMINSISKSRLESPIEFGYRDSVKNIQSQLGDNAGLYSRFKYGVGALGGAVQSWLEDKTGFDAGNLITNNLNVQQAHEFRSAMADNFISPEIGSISGNDFLSQFGQPAVAVYWCGCTDAEQFAFCRYMEEYGSACNGRLNPITNENDILGSNAIIEQFNGQTFYQFSHITIDGKMPLKWKQNIKMLFETGVYLIG